MAITGHGFDGTLLEGDWALLAGLPGVHDQTWPSQPAGDLAVTISTSALEAYIAAGTYNTGAGVLVRNTLSETRALSNPTSGSRWDTVAALVDWMTNTVTLVVVQGDGSVAVPWQVMESTPGTRLHVPLALVKLTAGSAAPAEVRDLRRGLYPLPAAHHRKTSEGINIAAGKSWALSYGALVRNELPVNVVDLQRFYPGTGVYDIEAVIPITSGGMAATLRVNSTVSPAGTTGSPGGTELVYSAVSAGAPGVLIARAVRLGPDDSVQVIVTPSSTVTMVGAQPYLNITRVAEYVG